MTASQQDEERVIEAEADAVIPFAYHILPAIDWLNKQTEIKKYTVRILNVPRRAKPVHIERLVRNRLKEAKGP